MKILRCSYLFIHVQDLSHSFVHILAPPRSHSAFNPLGALQKPKAWTSSGPNQPANHQQLDRSWISVVSTCCDIQHLFCPCPMSRIQSFVKLNQLNRLLLTAPGASADPCRSERGKPATWKTSQDVDVKLALFRVWGRIRKLSSKSKGCEDSP